MGKCITATQRVTFDVSDPQITVVTVERTIEGDCPIGLKARVTKTFPARHSILEILQMPGGVVNHLDWE